MRVKLQPALPEDVVARLGELRRRPVNLYLALANQPDLLRAWIEFAAAVRTRCRLPRALRELVILRCAQLYGSEYEWVHHLEMAREAGVGEEQVAALAGWRGSEAFSAQERAALRLAEAVFDGEFAGEVGAEVERAFPEAGDRVELIVTAGMYTMVPRMLEALGVPLEDEYR